MGFIGDLFSSSKGAGFQAQGTNIIDPFQQQQAQQLYGQQQNNLGQQNAFANALAAQGGIGNQASVFHQQQGLANQLGQQAQGAGPNPALAQLANTTGQNVAQQSALMGSQRGAGQNAGLIARQAGQQGAQIQQQASGQAALLRAQQQLAAQQQLQQQQQLMAQLASQQVGQQQGALSGVGQNINAAQQNVYSALGNQNNANVGMQSNINNANAAIAQQNQKQQGGIFNGIFQAAGMIPGLGGLGGIHMAHGGEVEGPVSASGRFLAQNYKSGGKVAGKARVEGDSSSNDTVPAMLSPGEIVVPRTAAKDPKKAAAFAAAVSRRGKK